MTSSLLGDKFAGLHIDLNLMTHEEIADFEKVMNRIDEINNMEINRIRRLKTSAGLSDNTKSFTAPIVHSGLQHMQCRSCGTLCLPANVLVGKATTRTLEICRLCLTPVCQVCCRWGPQQKLRICPNCHRKFLLEAKTGNWFYRQMRKRLSADHSSETSSPIMKQSSTIHSTGQSPKRVLLHRLRSYNSVHEELDEFDRTLNENSFVDPIKWGVQDRADYSNGPSFYINSEQESEDEVKLDLNDDIVNSNKNYYRPLSHISNHPLKSSSNGSPVPVEEHQAELCRSVEYNAANICTGGEVLIELDFNFRMSQFIIILRQCRNLPQVESMTNPICPYLFVLLLPDRSKKSRRTTSVKKNCLFPVYDQIFKYSINFNELESRSVLVMLCHKDDMSSRDLALGQVIIPLSFIDFSHPIVRWYSFQLLIEQNSNMSRIERSFSSVPTRSSNIPPYFGEISLAIKHLPRHCNNSSNNGELHVWVKSMRNVAQYQLNSSTNQSRRLSSTDERGMNENRIMENLNFGSSKILSAVAQLGQNQPVARVCLLPYRKGMQSTSPAKSSLDNDNQYLWSTILKFSNVDIEEIRTRSLEITIWVNSKHGWLNRIIQPRCVGGVRLCRGARDCNDMSPYSQRNQMRGASTGMIEEKMWSAMLERDNTWVDGTIKLKMDSSFLNMNMPELH